MKSVQDRLEDIEARNRRVELDKAWETSLVRRVSISFLTYVIVVTYLFLIDNYRPFVNALVPAVGYFLSTLVMKSIRRVWQKKQ